MELLPYGQDSGCLNFLAQPWISPLFPAHLLFIPRFFPFRTLLSTSLEIFRSQQPTRISYIVPIISIHVLSNFEMGNNKRERRQRARERAREQKSGPSAVPATDPPPATTPPQTPAPVTLDDLSMRVRPEHRIDDMIRMGQVFEGLKMESAACRLYDKLLPLAQNERGWDDPVTLSILASFLRALHATGDTAGMARVRSARAAGPSMAPPPQALPPTNQTPGVREVVMTIRRDHLEEDLLKIARMNHQAGMLDTPSKSWYLDQARFRYLDLLKGAEEKRGSNDPVAMGIVASLLEVFHEQGDRAAALKLMLDRRQGGTVG